MIDPNDERRLHDLLDDRLDEAGAADLRARLETDVALRDAWVDLLRLRETLRAESGPRAPHDFLSSVRRRIATVSAASGEVEGATGGAPLSSLAEARQRHGKAVAGNSVSAGEAGAGEAPGGIRWRGVGLAAAAMLVAAIGVGLFDASRSPSGRTPASAPEGALERAAAPDPGDEPAGGAKREAVNREAVNREAVNREAVLRATEHGKAGSEADAASAPAVPTAPSVREEKEVDAGEEGRRARRAGSVAGRPAPAPPAGEPPAAGPRFIRPGDAVPPGLREPSDSLPPAAPPADERGGGAIPSGPAPALPAAPVTPTTALDRLETSPRDKGGPAPDGRLFVEAADLDRAHARLALLVLSLSTESTAEKPDLAVWQPRRADAKSRLGQVEKAKASAVDVRHVFGTVLLTLSAEEADRLTGLAGPVLPTAGGTGAGGRVAGGRVAGGRVAGGRHAGFRLEVVLVRAPR